MFRTLTIGLLGLAMVGCAEVDPKADQLPFEMYDSPVIASSRPEAAPPKRLPAREESADETVTAEREESESNEASARATTSSTSSERESTDPDDSRPALSATRQSESDDSPASPTTSSESVPDRASPEPSKHDEDDRSANADAARYTVAIYELNGVTIPGEAHSDIPALYRHCREKEAIFQSKKPKPGDLVFFHNVNDANGDGRNNDWYTLVGLVEATRTNGTVKILGYRNGKVRSFSMNLEKPDTARAGNRTLNTKLREERADDPPFTQHLAGQLFAGYCSLLGDRSQLLVVDNWQPGMELERPSGS